MQRVTFELAQALKRAGFPQECNVHIPYYDENGQFHYGSQIGAPKSSFKEQFYAPTYIDVWLWLWRDKKIHFGIEAESYPHDGMCTCDYVDCPYTDPEDAIVAGVTYFYHHGLIK